jgi:hypothetical protein
MAKKKLVREGASAFSTLTDLKPGPEPRNLGKELFNKNWHQETIDSFEIASGIKQPKKNEEIVQRKVKVFCPEHEGDKNLMMQLMNSKNHRIVYYKDNFTPQGEYKAFVVYEEILKEDKEEQ